MDMMPLLIAIVGSGALTAATTKLIEVIGGRGKRERDLRRQLLAYEELAIQYRRLAVTAGLDLTDWPPLPE